MGLRRRGRELALQLLFQVEMTRDPVADVIRRFWVSEQPETGSRDFAETLARGTLEHLPAIDRRIQGVADNWRLERMAVVDRNVLRLAVFELIVLAETPPVVVIDEAIEVVRRYGAPESVPFINGILDAVRREIEKVTPQP